MGRAIVLSGRRQAVDITCRFGKKIKRLRLEKGMTQIQVAERFGIDRTFLSDVERGRKSVSLAMIEVIAIGFNVTLPELFTDV